jgi:hypothetical protein
MSKRKNQMMMTQHNIQIIDIEGEREVEAPSLES